MPMKGLGHIWAFGCWMTFSILFTSCYNQIALTGGPKDDDPPQIDTTVSTGNYQLYYEKDAIYLEFDEFINLKNPGRQIVVSPPLAYPIDVKHRGKKININFDEREELKDNATYIVNFGESIADFTENNLLKNFSFVFSTGAYIDSLNISGAVVNALTREPVENITVMLYDQLEDSIVYKDRPFYFAKTNDKGFFELNNLRSDTFKIVCLEDLNLNYLYEDNVERFGFLLDSIALNDSSDINVELALYKKKSPPQYLDADVRHDGLFSFRFDQDLLENPVSLLNSNLISYSEMKEKNIEVWIRELNQYPYRFVIHQDTLFDTISVRRPPSKDQKVIPSHRIISSNVTKSSGLHPSDSLVLQFNVPLDSFDISKFSIQDSLSLSFDQVELDTIHRRNMIIRYPWEEGQDYIITMDSSSVFDFFGRAIDSTSFEFEVGRRNSFGSINLTFVNAEENTNYIVTLIADKKDIHKWDEVDGLKAQFDLKRLPPGSYSLKVIVDKNNNKVWDPGDYLGRRYPEDIHNIELEPLKENRILESTIDLSSLENKEE